MKVEINNVEALSLTEVVDQLVGCGALQIAHDKKLGESRLECGCDLDIDIMENDPSDPRIDGCLSHTEEFTLSDIREHFTQGEWYAWAKDEDGNDILLCFN